MIGRRRRLVGHSVPAVHARGSFGVCRLERPEARNAMTPKMYFGIRYAVSHLDTDASLAGLLITGTADLFAPGGELSTDGKDGWLTFASALGMDVTPFDTLRQPRKPVVAAVNGFCHQKERNCCD